MRGPLPHVLALALGVGCALLVACGGAGTKGGIPAASAGELKSQIADVQQAVDDGRCEDVSGRLRQVDDSIDALPSTVQKRLRQSLRDAGDRLHDRALAECEARTETTQTQTLPTETQTVPTETQTQTVPTPTPTVPAPTNTTPTPTTTRPAPPPPPKTIPPVPPAEPAVPPPGTPGGGASPEVPG